MGKKVSTLEVYNGIDIELWYIPGVGYLYHAFIKGVHEYFGRYRDARAEIVRRRD